MNPYQLARQLRYRLRARTWGGTGTVLFASDNVVVSPLSVQDAIAQGIPFPFCLIAPGSFESDKELPLRLTWKTTVSVAVDVPLDRFGQAAILGGSRTNLTSSAGRGLLEYVPEIMAVVAEMSRADGIYATAQATGQIDGTLLAAGKAVAWTSFNVEAIGTATAYYHPARVLRATASGGGAVALTWALPPDRWDRINVVLRRAAGATAPTSATAGTGVTLGSALATAVTDTPGVGQFSYALFAGYDQDGDGDVDTFSASVTRTVTAT